LLRALAEFERPRTQIVVRCARDQQTAWRTALRTHAPVGVPSDVFVIPTDVERLPGILAARVAAGDMGAAYVCSGMTCQAPVTSPAALADALHATIRG
jgi:uncharacterized protein YyaL (SSP411 family)